MFLGHSLRLTAGGGGNVQQPALALSLRSASLDSRLAFSRASGATDIINGQLVLFGADAPRISTANGLLMEDSRTNLAFGSSFAAVTGITVTSGQSDPLGGSNAFLCVEDASTAQHCVQTNVVAYTIAAHTVSVFVKPGTCNRVQMRVTSNVVVNGHANFHLSGAGAVTLTGGGIAATAIQALANGWYRIAMTFTAAAVQGSDIRLFSLVSGSEGAAPSVAGSNRSFYAYGCQSEAGSVPTSYIPTTTLAATRALENCTLALGGWFNEAEGTLAAEGVTGAAVDAAATNARLLRLDNGGSSMVHELRRNNPDGTGRAGTTTSNVVQSNLMFAAWPLAGSLRMAYAYRANDMAGCQNAGAVQTDSAAPDGMPAGLTTLRIGSAYNTGALGGYVHQVRYWRTRLGNDQLGALTS